MLRYFCIFYVHKRILLTGLGLGTSLFMVLIIHVILAAIYGIFGRSIVFFMVLIVHGILAAISGIFIGSLSFVY